MKFIGNLELKCKWWRFVISKSEAYSLALELLRCLALEEIQPGKYALQAGLPVQDGEHHVGIFRLEIDKNLPNKPLDEV